MTYNVFGGTLKPSLLLLRCLNNVQYTYFELAATDFRNLLVNRLYLIAVVTSVIIVNKIRGSPGT